MVNALSEPQKRRLLSELKHADNLLADIEAVLTASSSKAAFPKYRAELSPRQVKIIQDYVSRLRSQMLRVAEAFGIERGEPPFGAVHSIRTILAFLDIAFQELRPKHMRGYGEIPAESVAHLNGLADELQSIVARMDAYLASGLGSDLESRLERLAQAGADTSLLARLEKIIASYGLVEFREPLAMILDRVEHQSYEIALFGRVSTGKSSLLNHLLGEEILPVGVNPITAVPTRICYGPTPQATVWFADRPPERCPLARLAEFATEQFNPGNELHVTRVVVELPSRRLSEGVVFVDTPGLGSLATAGAEETRAYLPRCDLGVVLVDAASTLTHEDLATIQSLLEAGNPACLLLSKADLLAPGDRARAVDYITKEVEKALGLEVRVYPVSIMGEHAALLDRWIEEQIRPLYSRHKELAAESVARKTGALREAVEAALRARLERAGRASQAGAATARKLEASLRRAAGKLEEARKSCERQADELARAGRGVLRRAADSLLRNPEKGAGEALAHALTEAALSAGQVVREELHALAEELSGALEVAAASLGPPPTSEEDLANLIREMPHPDSAPFDVSVRPSLLARLSPAWESRRLQARLSRHAGEQVTSALTTYARLLSRWARRTIEEIQRAFDAQAEFYRAELARIAGAGETGAVDAEAIRRDLEELRSPAPAHAPQS